MAGTWGAIAATTLSVGQFQPKKITKLLVSFTADASDGSLPALPLGQAVGGRVLKMEYIKGATTVTNSSKIVILDPATSVDELAGSGTITTGATSQLYYPVIASGIAIQPIIGADSQLNIVSNAVHSATGQIALYLGDV